MIVTTLNNSGCSNNICISTPLGNQQFYQQHCNNNTNSNNNNNVILQQPQPIQPSIQISFVGNNNYNNHNYHNINSSQADIPNTPFESSTSPALPNSCNSTNYTPTPTTTPSPPTPTPGSSVISNYGSNGYPVEYNYTPSPCSTPNNIQIVSQQPHHQHQLLHHQVPYFDFNFNQIQPQQLEFHLRQLQELNKVNNNLPQPLQYTRYQPQQQPIQYLQPPIQQPPQFNNRNPKTYIQQVIVEELANEDDDEVDDDEEEENVQQKAQEVEEDEESDLEDEQLIDPKHIKTLSDKEKSIKSKMVLLKSSRFNNVRTKVNDFIHEFTAEPIINEELNIRGSKDFSYLKYKSLNSSLDNYITQERIDILNALNKHNIEKLKKDFNLEIKRIESIRSESLSIMKSIQLLTNQIRPPLLEDTDFKAQRNHIYGFFSLIISHQKCLSFDFIYQMRPNSMDHQHSINTSGNGIVTNNVITSNSSIVDSKKNRRTLNDQYKTFISDYFKNHSDHPYPNHEEKTIISALIDLSKYQRNNWFSNKRSREKNQRIANLKKQCS